MSQPERVIDLRPVTIACTLAISMLGLAVLAGAWISPVAAVTYVMSRSDFMTILILVRLLSVCAMLVVYNAAFWLDLYFIAVSRIALISGMLGMISLSLLVYPYLPAEAKTDIYALICARLFYMALVYFNLRVALRRRDQQSKDVGSKPAARVFF